LKLNQSKIEDAGVYNLIASNRVGKITAKTELIVQGNFEEFGFSQRLGFKFSIIFKFHQNLLEKLLILK
jgi:hypothetical protein